MEEHLLELAGTHDLTLRWVSSWSRAESFPELREVLAPRCHTGADYLIGLHEVGHVLDPLAVELAKDGTVRGTLLCEAAAWSWALAEAMTEHLTPRSLEAMTASLRSHATRQLFPQDRPRAAV